MKTASRIAVTASALVLLSASAFADVIPAAYGADSGDRAKIEAKLTDMGLKSETARVRASSMTDDEASYFAEDVQRIQVSGQEIWAGQTSILWYELLGGAAALGGAIGVIWFMADEA